jgi:hypothetical protein
MRRFIFLGVLLIMVLCLAVQSYAQVSLSTVLFLRIAAGARAAGMGEAFVAIADDATATHWNPAGLGLYPLASTWIDYKGKAANQFKALALLKNDLPESNYKRYNLWAISSSDLHTWDGKDWRNSQVYPVSSGETAESIVRKYTQEQDETRLRKMLDQAASQNCGANRDSLENLKNKILALSPQDSPHRQDLEKALEDLILAWGNLQVEKGALSKFLNLAGSCLSDSVLSAQTEESLINSAKKPILKSAPEAIELPYSLIFMDSLNFLISDENNLWVGANSGLYRYDGKVWRRFSAKDGLVSDRALSMALTPGGTAFVGTDSGVVRFDGKNFSRIYLAPEVKDQRVTQIAARNDREIWAATSDALLNFDGNLFVPYFMLTVKSPEEFDQQIKQFMDREDEQKLQLVYKKTEELNFIPKEQVSSTQPLKIEYSLPLEGKVTCLAFDKKGGLLVGTENGLLKFDEGKWKKYGYRKYEVKDEKTVEDVAAKFLPNRDKERIENLSRKIVEYNHLPTRELNPGQVLYVYANSLGSRILSIAMIGENNLFVGTEYGTLRFDGETWGKYYHSNLEKARTHTIISKDKDIFFGTDDQAVIYAHAKRELTFMHAALLPELAEDVNYEYLSYVQNTENWGTLGGNITFISYGTIQRTSEIGVIEGEINPYEVALTLSYGTKMGNHLAFGLGAKYIYSSLSPQGAGKEQGSGTGSSFAIDVGLIYKPPFERLTLGAAITNLGPNVSYIDVDQSDPLPRNLALGFAYKIFDTPYNKLTAVGEINKELVDVGGIGDVVSQAVKNVGAEYWYANYVALRAGYIYDKLGDIRTWTFGAGLRISLLRVDFAYVPANKNVALANTTRISGTVRF